MAAASQYALESIRDSGEFALYRAREHGNQSPVLVVAPTAEQPLPQILRRLEREYSLAAELEPAWAAKPLALTRHEGRTILVPLATVVIIGRHADQGTNLLARELPSSGKRASSVLLFTLPIAGMDSSSSRLASLLGSTNGTGTRTTSLREQRKRSEAAAVQHAVSNPRRGETFGRASNDAPPERDPSGRADNQAAWLSEGGTGVQRIPGRIETP